MGRRCRPRHTHILDPVVWHLLKVLQLSQEKAWALQGHIATQDRLSLRKVTPAVAVPLPNPAQATQCLHTKLTANDDSEAFLGTFKRVTT